MTFLEALRTGLPMRRQGNLSTPWLALGHEKALVKEIPGWREISIPRWREISTGVPVGLHSWDYMADDWEVMANRAVCAQGQTP